MRRRCATSSGWQCEVRARHDQVGNMMSVAAPEGPPPSFRIFAVLPFQSDSTVNLVQGLAWPRPSVSLWQRWSRIVLLDSHSQFSRPLSVVAIQACSHMTILRSLLLKLAIKNARGQAYFKDNGAQSCNIMIDTHRFYRFIYGPAIQRPVLTFCQCYYLS